MIDHIVTCRTKSAWQRCKISTLLCHTVPLPQGLYLSYFIIVAKISTLSSIVLIYSYYSALIQSYFCVLSCPVLSCPILSCPILSCPILSYPIPFSPLSLYPVLISPHLSFSYLIFLLAQTRAISCYTSTAIKKIRNARAGEWRVEEKDSGMHN